MAVHTAAIHWQQPGIQGLVDAIEEVLPSDDGMDEDEHDDDRNVRSVTAMMRYMSDHSNQHQLASSHKNHYPQKAHHHVIPTRPWAPEHQQPEHQEEPLSLPSLLESLGKGSLANIPQERLARDLRPVLQALERLNAEDLLELTPVPLGQGPHVRKGYSVRPIYSEIVPPLAAQPQPDDSCVRYLHIAEVPEQYSIGIFVFEPFARIPLHDHPNMCVLSRVLYGDLQRMSLDLAPPQDAQQQTLPAPSWRGGWFGNKAPLATVASNERPAGSRWAYKRGVDHLEAPDVTMLYPLEGNLHEFVAGPQGAAVLDVLLPPYDHVQNRDCTFYNIEDDATSSTLDKRQACWIIPTGQPENFHCISGQYRNLGEAEGR